MFAFYNLNIQKLHQPRSISRTYYTPYPGHKKKLIVTGIVTGKRLSGVRVHAETICRPAPPVHCLILDTPNETKSCCHVTPASSRSIYGNSQQITGKETATVHILAVPLSPRSIYGHVRQAIEREVKMSSLAVPLCI